jgi:serine/threonine protein kinase
MGAVYLARERFLDRRVAVNALPGDAAALPHARERFLREARTAARLTHPNIVALPSFGEAGDTLFNSPTTSSSELSSDPTADSGSTCAAGALGRGTWVPDSCAGTESPLPRYEGAICGIAPQFSRVQFAWPTSLTKRRKLPSP